MKNSESGVSGAGAIGSRRVVVGVGASAGGIEALELMLPSISAGAGITLVVVMHLSDRRKTLLPEVLARFTPYTVAMAEHGARLQPDHLYVAPPGQFVHIRDETFELAAPKHLARVTNPIDNFFASLATAYGDTAIGVILSGSGNDGTLGAKSIKECGGLTIAQGGDGDGPQFSDMPNSAIHSSLIDLVLPAERIGAKLFDYAESFRSLDAIAVASDEKQRLNAREAICATLRDQVGHDFSGYKHKTFERRVQRRMQVVQIRDVDAYVTLLRSDPNEVGLLFRDLLINVTDFFRDGDSFEVLERDVIPKLFEGRGASDVVRIWVPACATGEEVYSIAILVREHLETLAARPKVQIFATDIDEQALSIARTGRYPSTLLGGLSEERLSRHFLHDNDSYVIRKDVRDLCVFSSHSLVRDPPFSRIDLVSCRNLLIYFGPDLQAKVIPVFHYALRPQGFLFLGIAESPGAHQLLFEPVDKKSRIFRRRDLAGPRPPIAMFTAVERPHASIRSPATGIAYDASLRRTIEARVLDQFAPAHVVVNQDGEIVHYSSRTGNYLEQPAGQPNKNLLGLARKGLRLELRNALREAARLGEPVQSDQVMVEGVGGKQQLSLRVQPLAHDNQPLYLVLFIETTSVSEPGDPIDHDGASDASKARVDALDGELNETRERLQGMSEEFETAVEELRAANEELVSVNEELQSTNEELETSKEEMQSLNEELQTVNMELSRKLEELDQANADLRNLFDSTEIATVFLDNQMRIRSFTQAIAGIFNLIASDRGRHLTDIVHHLDYDGLHEDLATVRSSGNKFESQVRRRDRDTVYVMRMLPYTGDGGAVVGVVVTFVDVTSFKHAEAHQQQLITELNHRVKNVLGVLTSLAMQTLGEQAQQPPFVSFLERVQALSRSYELVTSSSWTEIPLRDVVEREMMPHVVGDHRIKLEGPEVMLSSRLTLALSMVLHELATNAVKYGALSVACGGIEVTWETRDSGDGETELALLWKECDGPSVVPPQHAGLGRMLIEGQLEYEFGGKTVMEFHPDGLRASLHVPLTRTE